MYTIFCWYSPGLLDPEVPERAKMAFEMKDRLDQLRRSSVRFIVRASCDSYYNFLSSENPWRSEAT